MKVTASNDHTYNQTMQQFTDNHTTHNHTTHSYTTYNYTIYNHATQRSYDYTTNPMIQQICIDALRAIRALSSNQEEPL
jgi:hypothetical protein